MPHRFQKTNTLKAEIVDSKAGTRKILLPVPNFRYKCTKVLPNLGWKMVMSISTQSRVRTVILFAREVFIGAVRFVTCLSGKFGYKVCDEGNLDQCVLIYTRGDLSILILILLIFLLLKMTENRLYAIKFCPDCKELAQILCFYHVEAILIFDRYL